MPVCVQGLRSSQLRPAETNSSTTVYDQVRAEAGFDDDMADFVGLRSSWSVNGEKAGEDLQRRFRSMVLHAFRIGFRGLGGDIDRKRQADARARGWQVCVLPPSGRCRGRVGSGGHQTLPLEAGDALDCGRMRNARRLATSVGP